MKKIEVPGSKSISNRVLILAALSPRPTLLKNLLISDDIVFLQRALTNFGVVFTKKSNGDLLVTPPKNLVGNDSVNFIGNGGTPARLLVALSTVMTGEFELNGVERMHERPFLDLFEAIKDLGVSITYAQKTNYLPAKFLNNSAEKTSRPVVKISGKISSQFISGLLLAASKMSEGLVLEIIDEIPSLPYVKMTLEVMRLWGNKIVVSDDFKRFEVSQGLENPAEFLVAADSSSASYPQAFALLKKEVLEITNFGSKTLQGDEQFLEVVKKFGGRVERRGEAAKIFPAEKLQAVSVLDFSMMPDVSMTGMILAAFSEGTTKFVGLESLRVKECDRITAMAEGLIKLGVEVMVNQDDMIIIGNPNLGMILAGKYGEFSIENELVIDSYDDHRIAMVFGLIREIFSLNFTITDEPCVSKSWPDFWSELALWNDNLRPVSALVLKDASTNKYLIVKKPRKNNAWQFPQGGKDEGETDKQAAIRELQEECGETLSVKVKGEKPFGAYKYLFPKDFKRHDVNIKGAHVKFFLAEFLGGKVELDMNEIVDYQWVAIDQFGDYFDDRYLAVISEFLN